ncbi:mortality factor 4-like protein 1 [Cimex lectularius]|uniref:Chromo domain-containing protein n=1 Tax=Cimex lectularius TaxID=79782 RepID=A0A8I6RP48_CIMLE|nr:mortality factor 4-like protein 1 [Cimex lectularius]
MSSQEVHTVENDLLPRFGVGDKLLCYRGPCLFEAKCKKVRFSDDQNTYMYFVHYCGWNRHWDEWLPENKIVQHNEFNLRLQKELEIEHKDTGFTQVRRSTRTENWRKNELGEGTSGTSARTSKSSEGEKTQKNSTAEPGEQIFNLPIGEVLADHIAEDWVKINMAKKLVKLPAEVTVDKIIESYVAERAKTHQRFDVEIFQETAEGVKRYFNVMLETQILYESEFRQCEKLFSDRKEVEVSGIYGGIHLVRMLTRLGWAMSYFPWGSSSVKVLEGYINDFIQYISSEAANIFHPDNYIDGPEE